VDKASGRDHMYRYVLYVRRGVIGKSTLVIFICRRTNIPIYAGGR